MTASSTCQNQATVDLSLSPKQSFCFQSNATEILYGGAAGGGKSHHIRIESIFWALTVPGLQIYLFRRNHQELIDSHVEGNSGYLALLEPLLKAKSVKYNASGLSFKFNNGSRIKLAHIQYEKDLGKYLSKEIHVAYFDELTTFEEKMYRFIRNRMRMVGVEVPDEYKGRLPRMVSGTNPGNIGHQWVKSSFIDPMPPYQKWITPDLEGGMIRQFIPALMTDNPKLDIEDYRKKLRGLGLEDKALADAMEKGDWDIAEGAYFADVWKRDVHILKPFDIPPDWYVDRTFDWGSSHPFSVGWFAESNGTPVTLDDGTTRHFPKGTIIRIAEYYGWNGKPDKGLNLTTKEIGIEIKKREKEYDVLKKLNVRAGAADSSIFDRQNNHSYYDGLRDAGAYFIAADKSPYSRRTGFGILRSLMKNSVHHDDEPGFYVFDTCTNFIRTVPVLPRSKADRDDIDTKSEDHIADEVRYRVLAKKNTAKKFKLGGL